jgi:4-hydroxy-3-polyprenylbenzoate decarboxylase
LLDATSKELSLNHFKRPWPNIIVMDDTTIASVDKNWGKLTSFEFIDSPSRRFKKMVKNPGAVANPGFFI